VKQPEAKEATLNVTHFVLSGGAIFYPEGQSMAEHIVAIFSTESAAAAAARDLENVGVFSFGNQALQTQYGRGIKRHFC
jgi:hypothetical protein